MEHHFSTPNPNPKTALIQITPEIHCFLPCYCDICTSNMWGFTSCWWGLSLSFMYLHTLCIHNHILIENYTASHVIKTHHCRVSHTISPQRNTFILKQQYNELHQHIYIHSYQKIRSKDIIISYKLNIQHIHIKSSLLTQILTKFHHNCSQPCNMWWGGNGGAQGCCVDTNTNINKKYNTSWWCSLVVVVVVVQVVEECWYFGGV